MAKDPLSLLHSGEGGRDGEGPTFSLALRGGGERWRMTRGCRPKTKQVVSVSAQAAWCSQTGCRRPWVRPAVHSERIARRDVARIEEQDSGFQMTPPTSSEELRERL
jgi:hypothetical protein